MIGKCACASDISFVGYANYMICLSFSLVSNSSVCEGFIILGFPFIFDHVLPIYLMSMVSFSLFLCM